MLDEPNSNLKPLALFYLLHAFREVFVQVMLTHTLLDQINNSANPRNAKTSGFVRHRNRRTNKVRYRLCRVLNCGEQGLS